MNLIYFPTREVGHGLSVGLPMPADPCVCVDPIVHDPDETCDRCGHFTAERIERTWRERERQMRHAA